MVRHDLPTPPPPTTTSLYSLRNWTEERSQRYPTSGRRGALMLPVTRRSRGRSPWTPLSAVVPRASKSPSGGVLIRQREAPRDAGCRPGDFSDADSGTVGWRPEEKRDREMGKGKGTQRRSVPKGPKQPPPWLWRNW